jgi:hypothetical protein
MLSLVYVTLLAVAALFTLAAQRQVDPGASVAVRSHPVPSTADLAVVREGQTHELSSILD